ncbi:uncharacterized protein G2W53_007088 [Senna tora]|uniref:Uncharacterized protein n=1 Tax=Senna tora TaxID=362788 RepID=A0A835CEL3_9FABA|nr:uncharacterized protein G2W53_007088 [Senna tora]
MQKSQRKETEGKGGANVIPQSVKVSIAGVSGGGRR